MPARPIIAFKLEPGTIPITTEPLQQDDTCFAGSGDCACAPTASDIGDDKPFPSPLTDT